MAAQVEYKEHERLIFKMANKVRARLYAGGARTVQIEDIVQEMAIAWCKARDSWDEGRNVPFVPYMLKCCFRHINVWVELEMRQHNIAPFELDMPINDDGDTAIDLTTDEDAESPEAIMIDRDWDEYIERQAQEKNGLSPRAWLFLKLLRNPPKELQDMLRGLRARADFARARGMTGVVAPTGITCAMVFDLMGADRVERSLIYKSVNRFAKRINK